jgi:hypothetical protein
MKAWRSTTLIMAASTSFSMVRYCATKSSKGTFTGGSNLYRPRPVGGAVLCEFEKCGNLGS